MEAQDKITEQMKEAARNAESQPFPGMERVWEKVTERLDEKSENKAMPFFSYKKIAAAAAILIAISVGTAYLLNEEKHEVSVAVNKPAATISTPEKVSVDTDKAIASIEPVAHPPKNRLAAQHRINDNSSISMAENSGITENASEAVISYQSPTQAAPPLTIPYDGKIKGQVVDQNGEGIPGASIRLKGTIAGTMTDVDGNYELEVADSNPVIEISAMGSATKDIAIAGNFNVGITKLEPGNNALSEVVIAQPYGPPIQKRSYVGAADVVTAEQIQKMPVADITKSLEGASPGVQVTNGGGMPSGTPNVASNFTVSDINPYRGNQYALNQNYNLGYSTTQPNNYSAYKKKQDAKSKPVAVTTGNGQPGSGSSISVRGMASLNNSTAPLIIVDGAPYDGDITNINPTEVATMNVLKDATSTSLYGSRGSNGVIVITTKNGLKQAESNKKKKFSIWDLFGKSKPTTLVPQAAPPVAIIVPQAETPTQEDYDPYIENPFESPAQSPLSTFSIDVDNAAYTNVRRFINNGQKVPKDAVRVEEMINFFHYRYPQPESNDPFSINTEYSDAPWNPQHKLLKIGLQGKIIPPEQLPASNFVFLIDVSGSMDEPNKLPLLKSSLTMLVDKLRKEDRVAIVVYAGAAGLVLPSTSGENKKAILDALNNLQAGGSTAGGAGIELAYKIAQENFKKEGNNRVILATDGDFNVGASSNTDMQTLIEEKRKSNIFLTCLGYGMGNYKDSKMEILADKGNGNYAYIDNLQEANRFLVKEFSGSMYSIAKDVKIQIEFNPLFVQAYRLIGYENRKLKAEDFANDTIDAGELGSGHTVTALYEVIPAGVNSEFTKALPSLKYTPAAASGQNYKDELATIKFRYKKPDGNKSIEMTDVIRHEPESFSSISKDYKLAAAVAWFGLKLRDSRFISNKGKKAILDLAKQGVDNDTDGYKAELVRLIEAAP
ncbi:DUF3520 domain-containing protein [Taibaiella lutea]|uniref:DUF3520 domain-containing protein n=1 Tax=Taibaiella lutea TaxID=2608001 RepID=A0A5M6CHF2_9BACT|nr:VWA domain-containing protein [Taibaiella lutea]KAA5534638.1 DUF3520 domain-containing protein [Taibaiella lutea]